MRRLLLVIIIGLLSATAAAQKARVYPVAFYNVENLFDTEYDESIGDHDFTPEGAYNWTETKYRRKLDNIALVLSRLAREYSPVGPVAIGLAEVENRRVLEDLVARDAVRDMGLEIVHYDSPDRRGIDVALLYNPLVYNVTSSRVYKYVHPEREEYVTRDQLLVSGTLAGEPTHFIVNHWPSRYGGASSSPLREYAAALTRQIADSLYAADPQCNIIIMGDFNDDPTDKSISQVLRARKKQKDVEPGGLFNPMAAFYDKGVGTLGYQGKWNLFDQIIVSESLLSGDQSRLRYWKAEIFNRDFLLEGRGRNKGYPFRTFSGNSFINGFSDHLPVIVYLIKSI